MGSKWRGSDSDNITIVIFVVEKYIMVVLPLEIIYWIGE